MSITFNTTDDQGLKVNMCDGNAATILDLLGIPGPGNGEDFGEYPAENFLGRVLLALALVDTTVDDEHGRPAVRAGRWVQCGSRPGYVRDRLGELHELAQWAVAHEDMVVWS